MLTNERMWKFQREGGGTSRSNKRIGFVYEKLVFVLSKCKFFFFLCLTYTPTHLFKYDLK